MDTNSSMQQKLSPQAVQDGVTGGYEAATCSSYCLLGRSIPKCSGGSIEGPAAGDRLGRHSSDLPWAGSGGAGVSIMNDDLLFRPTVHHLCSKKDHYFYMKKEGVFSSRSTHFGCTLLGTEGSCDTRPASSSPSLCIIHTAGLVQYQMRHSISHYLYYRASEGYGTTASPDIGGASNMDLNL